jgi:hypothetical protein
MKSNVTAWPQEDSDAINRTYLNKNYFSKM